MKAILGPDPMGRANASYRTDGAAFGGVGQTSARRRKGHTQTT